MFLKKEMHNYEGLRCLLKPLNCNNLGKTLCFLQDTQKSNSKIRFLWLKYNFSIFLTLLAKLRPCLFFKMSISESEAGSLIREMNRNIKVAIRSAVAAKIIINILKPVIFLLM